MKFDFRKVFSALMAVVFVFCVGAVISRVYQNQQAIKVNDAAKELAASSTVSADEPQVNIPEEPVPESAAPEKSEQAEEISEEQGRLWKPLAKEMQFLHALDLDALRQVSENVLGWIHIPGTPVDYPLMVFADNHVGLQIAWDGSYNISGSIYLECKNNRDFSDFNTLIYGHNNLNGEMFSSLTSYADETYFGEHPFIYIVTDDYVRRYRVFSAYEAGVTEDTYRLYFEDDQRKQSSLDHYLSSSYFKTGIVPTVEDRILTLSTCTNGGSVTHRFVVQAVLDGEFEK